MTKKISFGIVAVLIVLTALISSAATLFSIFSVYDNLLIDLPQRAVQYQKLSEIDELVRSEYFGNFTDEDIDDALASGFINGLSDTNSYYVTSEDYSDYVNLVSGKSDGIGVNAYYEPSVNSIVVSYVYPDSPAEKKGIVAGDYISSVNGKAVSATNNKDLISLICNSDKKSVIVAVKRSQAEAYVDYEFTSGYELESCEYFKSNSAGYIRLTALYESSIADFSEALDYFKEEKISSVILDLRNCQSINFDIAAKIIDLIVPVGAEGSGVIYSAKNSAGDTIIQYPSDSNAVNMSFAVLVNSRTQGATELIACDIRDFGKGVVVGETTSGHGTMQKVFNLDDGYVILTVAEIYPYISSSYNGTGIKPDIEILTSESFKNQLGHNDFTDDAQFDAAYNYLTGK